MDWDHRKHDFFHGCGNGIRYPGDCIRPKFMKQRENISAFEKQFLHKTGINNPHYFNGSNRAFTPAFLWLASR